MARRPRALVVITSVAFISLLSLTIVMKDTKYETERNDAQVDRYMKINLPSRILEARTPRYPLTSEELAEETDWLFRKKCVPQKNIAFLKIHKCASSTVQNMLMRYGYNRDLLFALPANSHIFSLETAFQASAVLQDAPFHTNKSNIFTMHTKWNKEEVSKILFADAVYFTMVREPSKAFMSQYDYFAFKIYYGISMEEFISRYERDMEHFMGCLGYNIMACDMGALPHQYNDQKAIRLLASQMDSDFDLVMVAERFEESLVLLSHLLCWSYEDLISLNVNSRIKEKYKLTPNIRSLLTDRLKPDYYIYEYFVDKFDKLVKAFGEERMAREVEQLRIITNAKIAKCGIQKQLPEGHDGPEVAGSSKVDFLVTNSTDPACQDFIRPEQAFVGRIKNKQEKLLKKLSLH